MASSLGEALFEQSGETVCFAHRSGVREQQVVSRDEGTQPWVNLVARVGDCVQRGIEAESQSC